MKIKRSLALLLWLMFVVFIAACSGEEADGGASEEEVNLNFISRGTPQELEVYQRAVESFNEEHEGITVEFNSIPGDDYTQILTTRLQGGQAPDIFYVEDFQMSTLIDNGSVLGMDDFLESEDSYVSEDDFPDDIWGPTERDGNKYALVPDVNPFVMYYNKTVFEQAGLDTPQEYFERGEWTWDTFAEVTDVLVENDFHGFMIGGGSFGLNPWIYNNGGDVEGDEEVTIDSDTNTVEAIEFVNDLVQRGNITFAGTLPSGQGEDAMFLSNQVGLIGAGHWLAETFIESGVDFDYIPYPSNTDNKIEPTMLTSAYVAVNSESEHQEEALKFASYYVSETGQEIRLADGGNSIPSLLGMEDIILDESEPEHMEYLIEALEISRPIEFEFIIPGLSNELENIYEAMYVGEVTTDEALEEAQEVMEEMAEDYGYFE